MSSGSDLGPSFEERKEKTAKRGILAGIYEKLRLKKRVPTLGNGTESDTSIHHVGREDPPALLSPDAPSRNSTNMTTSTAARRSGAAGAGVFWPADLLPQACPRARILVFGYDTKITNYGRASTNKNSIYSHAKDLLFALSRETEGCRAGLSGKRRQIIFVAHSLGGIVVKEVCVYAYGSALLPR